jgi:thioredoxin-related protein/tetratricopeptide (TPR) repeat protein
METMLLSDLRVATVAILVLVLAMATWGEARTTNHAAMPQDECRKKSADDQQVGSAQKVIDKGNADTKPANIRPAWVRDMEQAKKLAKANDKDLLLVFTATRWCHPCQLLDREVFHAKEFFFPASKDYVFVEFDSSTYGDSPSEKRREEEHRKLQKQFLADIVPTVILADPDGVPYAMLTGWEEGAGPLKALIALRIAQMAKSQRDRFLKNAMKLTGPGRAEQIHNAISVVEPLLGSIDDRGDDPILTFYKTQVEDILKSAGGEMSVLRKQYESRIERTKDWHTRHAVLARLKQFKAEEDYPKAIEYITSALETTTDKSIRWRLETARQTYLEWSKRYDDALANVRRLQRLPELSDKQRAILVDSEIYNLFNLKRTDEGLALYDQQIAATKSKTRLKWIGEKAGMIVAHGGTAKQTIPACLEYRLAAEDKSEHWRTASLLLGSEYQRAGQHQDAIKVFEEMLVVEKQPGTLLYVAESYIALGQVERAKRYIGDIKRATEELAISAVKQDQEIATYLRQRITELDKKTSGPKSKE